jgi:hypothetical protein
MTYVIDLFRYPLGGSNLLSLMPGKYAAKTSKPHYFKIIHELSMTLCVHVAHVPPLFEFFDETRPKRIMRSKCAFIGQQHICFWEANDCYTKMHKIFVRVGTSFKISEVCHHLG